MLEILIPGAAKLTLNHLVLDYNGTLAVDGTVAADAVHRLEALANLLLVHIITADTHGTVREQTKNLPCSVHILRPGSQDLEKRRFVERLRAESTVAVGNGRNDQEMLKRAALGIGVLGREGGCGYTMCHADVICTSIADALDLLIKPERLRATLRN